MHNGAKESYVAPKFLQESHTTHVLRNYLPYFKRNVEYHPYLCLLEFILVYSTRQTDNKNSLREQQRLANSMRRMAL